MSKRPILDEVMIMAGAASSDGELEKASYYGGFSYSYRDNPFIDQASANSPIHRYGKKFKKHKLEFNLFVYTKEMDNEAIEKTFDKVVKKLKREHIIKTLEGFQHLGVFHGDK